MKRAYIRCDKITEQELQDGQSIELTVDYQGKSETEQINALTQNLVKVHVLNPSTGKLEEAVTPRIVQFRDFYDNEIADKYEVDNVIVEPKFTNGVLEVKTQIKRKNEQGVTYEDVATDYILNISVYRRDSAGIILALKSGAKLTAEQINEAKQVGVNISNNADNNIAIDSSFDLDLSIVKDGAFFSDKHGFNNGFLSI